MGWLIAIILLPGLLWVMGNYTFWKRPRPAQLPRVLMYHDTSPDTPASGMNIKPERLIGQALRLRNQGYRLVRISELATGSGDHQVAITLDDGFASNYHHLFPLLQRHQIPCTIYLAPEIEGIEHLTPAQIEEMQASGLVEFGAHTLHHCNLTRLDDATSEKEIRESKLAVEQLTGTPCNSFSYPFGRLEPRHVAMVKRTGFSSAVTVRKRIKAITDPLQIPRIGINGKANRLQFHLAFTRGRYKL